MLVVFLQNAWAHDARGALAMERNRRLWLYATALSRSGQRLKVMFGDECFIDDDLWFDNTTPVVGIGANSKFPPDDDHILRVIGTHSPTAVVACGLQAEKALLRLWNGPLLAVPHPASRLLTNALYEKASELIDGGLSGRSALRQLSGCVSLVNLEAQHA